MSKIQVEIGIKVNRKTEQVTPLYKEIEEAEYMERKQKFFNYLCDILKEFDENISEELKNATNTSKYND